MTKDKNISNKAVGIIEDNAITGVHYGMVDLKKSAEKIIKLHTETISKELLAHFEKTKRFLKKLKRAENTKNK